MTVIYFSKFIVKVLLFIIFIPFILVWLYARYRMFRYALVKALQDADMPRDYAKNIAREMSMKNLLNRK